MSPMTEAPIVATMSETTANTSTSTGAVSGGAVTLGAVSPTPTDEEVVAIMAGVEALWPKPAVAVGTSPARSTAWRFSGRWWSRPVPARRDRPFR
jgi:hypothetical protein